MCVCAKKCGSVDKGCAVWRGRFVCGPLGRISVLGSMTVSLYLSTITAYWGRVQEEFQEKNVV